MRAAVLIKQGSALNAFEIRDVLQPIAKEGEVLIKVAASGLNFADVMARMGLYKEAPPLPTILGYDVAGTIIATGAGVTNFKEGDRVTALTRFGGYAEHAVAHSTAVIKIPEKLDVFAATALATQYCTAVYAAFEMVNLFEGNKVLIHSGAGGVGIALIQYAKFKKCEIFATAGSDDKIKFLHQLGVDHAINYTTDNFEKQIKEKMGNKAIDVIFDAVGGKSVKKGIRLLAPGGKIICYGAAALSNTNILGKIKTILGFGLYHPAQLMMASKSILGINMLAIGDHHPQIIKRCLQQTIHLYSIDVFLPTIAKVFNAADVGKAHEYFENRISIGKVVLKW